MSNLHDKRFYTVPKPDAWEYVCIPGKFRAGRVKYNIETKTYGVSMVSLHARPAMQGRAPQHDVLHFRGENPDFLRERILKSFPDAVFTKVDPDPEIDLKAQHASEMRQQKERQATIAETKRFDSLVVSEHRKIAASLSRADQLQASYESFNLFATDTSYGSPEWVAWFRQRVGFLSWPDSSYKNRDVLLQFCESRGQIVPRTEEIAEAMNYLLQHRHYYLKPSYKRSERDEINAVQPFEREESEPQISQEQIRQAIKALSGKFGMPLSVSVERLETCGIPNPEKMFAAIQAQYNPQPVAEKPTTELKQDLQALRNTARGGARPRIENMKGY